MPQAAKVPASNASARASCLRHFLGIRAGYQKKTLCPFPALAKHAPTRYTWANDRAVNCAHHETGLSLWATVSERTDHGTKESCRQLNSHSFSLAEAPRKIRTSHAGPAKTTLIRSQCDRPMRGAIPGVSAANEQKEYCKSRGDRDRTIAVKLTELSNTHSGPNFPATSGGITEIYRPLRRVSERGFVEVNSGGVCAQKGKMENLYQKEK